MVDSAVAGPGECMITIVLASAVALMFAAMPAPAEDAGTLRYVAPRGHGGKPDLNGTWRVMSRANWDLEDHAARAALAFREGPVNPVPAKEGQNEKRNL